jgi:Na+/H+ antiporter NhaA
VDLVNTMRIAALPVMGIITGFAAPAAVFLFAAQQRQPETDSAQDPASGWLSRTAVEASAEETSALIPRRRFWRP